MKYALIQDTRICEFATTATECFPVAPGLQWVQVADTVTVMDTFVNGAVVPYVAPAVPPTVPASITDRQFFQQLSVQGIITQADALAANAAVIPPALLTLINAMPADQQFNAKMIVSGATTFYRDNALTTAIGTAYGMSSAQIDAFFTAAAAL